MDNTEQIFQEQLQKLPATVVNFVANSEWNEELDNIGSMYNLDEDQIWSYKREATLVLAGLVHPDEFATVLGEETGLQGGVLEAVVVATEQKIFAPVRAALVDFFENEIAAGSGQAAPKAQEEVPSPAPQATTPPQMPQGSTVTPENLPVAPEPEHLMPPIASKEPQVMPSFVLPNQPLAAAVAQFVKPDLLQPKEPAVVPQEIHPFEEKMKQVFTASAPNMAELALNPVPPAQPAPVVPAPVEMSKPAAPTPAPQAIPSTPTASPVAPARRVDPYREPIED